MEAPLLEHVRFLGAFLRSPFDTGALAPSSAALAASMVEGLQLGSAHLVVEVGPGTGAFTRRILEEIGPQTRFLAIELNPDFARELGRRFPRVVVVNACAEELPKHLAAHGQVRANAILSGLPWVAFSEERQRQLLQAVVDSLAPDGWFVTFSYAHAAGLPPAKRMRQLLEARFAEVQRSEVVWRNLPPALVYRCRRDRSPRD